MYLKTLCCADVLTSTKLVSRAVTVEVVTLAELAAVPLLWVVSLLALAHATNTFPIVAADVCTIAAVPVHVLCGHVVAAAFTVSAHPALITPDTEGKGWSFRRFLRTKRADLKIAVMVLPAGSTFEGPITKVAHFTVLDASLMAVTFTDEPEGHLHLLCETQRLYLNHLLLA